MQSNIVVGRMTTLQSCRNVDDNNIVPIYYFGEEHNITGQETISSATRPIITSYLPTNNNVIIYQLLIRLEAAAAVGAKWDGHRKKKK